MSKRDYNESEQYFNESLEIYKILTRNESNFYLSDLANILNTASELFRLQNKFKQAVDFQNDSLNIYLKLSDKNPQKYLEFMASGYNNLAASYSQSNHSELAEQLWIKSLCIYRNLAKINLKAFLPLVAVSAVNLARYYTDGNTPDRSRALIFAVESYQSSLPFVNTLPDSKRDQNDALKIFAAWGEDVDAYLKNHNQATA
jgi:tetratricopeptide (TPR) repeat protein